MVRLPLATMVGCLLSSAAFASPVFQEIDYSPTFNNFLMLAQSDVGILSDSDLRRLNYYSERCLSNLIEIDVVSREAALQLVEANIIRLIDAGARSGLNQEQTAAFFQAYVGEDGLSKEKAQLFGGTDNLDSAAIFEAVAAKIDAATPEVDIDAINETDLMAIRSLTEADEEVSSEPQTETAEVIEAEVIEEVAESVPGPEIPADAADDIRAILERVQVIGEDWTIEVLRGDSLAAFSEALYGNRRHFRHIYDANRGVLRSPNILEVGDIITLPKEL